MHLLKRDKKHQLHHDLNGKLIYIILSNKIYLDKVQEHRNQKNKNLIEFPKFFYQWDTLRVKATVHSCSKAAIDGTSL